VSPAQGPGRSLEVEVRPPSPFRLPSAGGDRVLRRSGNVATRLLHVGGAPVAVHAWQAGSGAVRFRAEPLDPSAVAAPELHGSPGAGPPADRGRLEVAIERMRFALGVDDDLSDFYRSFRRDPLLGPLLRRRPHLRPRRRPWPWEALAWAITNQLIEAVRAARIQRRIVHRWGPHLGDGPTTLRDVPCAAVIAGRAPAELASTDLAARRAIALREVARDVAGGRCDPSDPAFDARLLARRNIGPWTVQCLGLHGRGDPDSLPAGDLAYLKLVGRLAGLGRRATIPEVEEFYAPYEPYRGLAGVHTVVGLYHLVARGGPQRLAA
jgi:3-methyladenine DNA glycosylase/8-oxoguanine DNA glycosylase